MIMASNNELGRILKNYQLQRGDAKTLSIPLEKSINDNKIMAPFKVGNISFITDKNYIMIGMGNLDEVIIIKGEKINLKDLINE